MRNPASVDPVGRVKQLQLGALALAAAILVVSTLLGRSGVGSVVALCLILAGALLPLVFLNGLGFVDVITHPERRTVGSVAYWTGRLSMILGITLAIAAVYLRFLRSAAVGLFVVALVCGALQWILFIGLQLKRWRGTRR